MSAAKSLTVIFGSSGGLSDVGKYVAMQAVKKECNVHVVCICASSSELTEKDIEVDPGSNTSDAKKAQQQEVKSTLQNTTVTKININQEDAQSELEKCMDNSGIVISCIGNRQPSMDRYMDIGMKKIVGAMKEKGIQRLVALSSMGIGDDFIPTGGMKIFWAFLLRTLLRSAYNDMQAMENTIRGSNVDYLIVRPVGIPPEKEPVASWLLFHSCEEASGKRYEFTMAKPDVAAYLFQEGMEGTLHGTAVTIAGVPG